MIGTRSALEDCLARDAAAYGVTRWTWRNRLSGRSRDQVLRWQRRWRRLEYLETARPLPGPLARAASAILWRLHARASIRMGFTIPIGAFGPGLCIVHPGTITVSELARVGADARIHPSTSIGRDDDGAATIGARLYLGPGARIVGDVTLGAGTVVGANAVVTPSFPAGRTLVGAPARDAGPAGARPH